MKITLHRWLLLVSLSITLAEDSPDLPLCPTNLQFFPQKLPMHCRMPRSAEPGSYADLPQYPTLPPLPESYFQSPSPDKQPPPVPIPIPPFPGMPPGMPMPGHMEGPMPGIPGMPGAMPMPMVGGPPHKLPVIVMPFYSQDHSFKKSQTTKRPHKHRDRRDKKKKSHKKKKKHHESENDSSSCEDASGSDDHDANSSSEHGFWKGRRKARRKISRRFNKHEHKTRRMESKNKQTNLLTPILQYVTKDGYVIFEKQISKNEAKDWLKPQSENTEIPEKKQEEKPVEKPQEDFMFNPKSAEEFFKLDEEEKRRNSMELKEAAATQVPTKRTKKQHRPLRFNPLINKNNEP